MAKHGRALTFPSPDPEEPLDEPLLNLKQAAKQLGLQPETLRKMAQRREIPSVKYPKLRMFEPSALRAHIAKHRVG